MHQTFCIKSCLLGSLVAFLPHTSGWAGDFPPAAGQPGSDAIPADSERIVSWAGAVTSFAPGRQRIDDPGSPVAAFGDPQNTLGPVDSGVLSVLSLGDGGELTVSFDPPLSDGPGFDLAVFENSFSDTFLELAFVEVSSDGIHFLRFPAISQTPTTDQVNSFGPLDPTNLRNLAGKYRIGFGTPFDLAELFCSDARVDINHIRYVRVVDVVGVVRGEHARVDSTGNPVNDPFPTAFVSSGFDLDGVAALNLNGGWLPGDATRDRIVDFADFLALAEGFGTSPAHWSEGDFDGSCSVDFEDFLALASHFGDVQPAARVRQ